MGDRASVQFIDSQGRKSAVLNDHWGGMEFVNAAIAFVKSIPHGHMLPMDRHEADAMMVEFIRSGHGDRVVCSEREADQSDNGHFLIDATDGSIRKHSDWDEIHERSARPAKSKEAGK